ncbi:MAG: flagellar basal body P-ring formation chaperone FlgA [Planctomycetaceae bacterium]|nr:flagellar basal body P-ring formation chaperone FlgA [Planctomycetaceae bacterium]
MFAAEIRFNVEARVSGVLVRLGDVSEIISDSNAESTRLKYVVLFPAPQKDEPRIINVTEIRDLLMRLGVNVLEHNFTGAKKITISNTDTNLYSANSNIVFANYQDNKIIQADLTAPNITNTNTNTPKNTPSPNRAAKKQAGLSLQNISPELIKHVESLVAESIRIHLRQRFAAIVPNQQPAWNVSLTLSREQTLALTTNGQIDAIDGGIEPFVGKQKFQIKLQRVDSNTNQNVVVVVDANLIPVTCCVVVIRNLPKGYVINESDVKIGECEGTNYNGNQDKSSEYFINTNDVIGKETTGNLRAGSVITADKIKRPTWIHKGDVVTILAKNNGVIIRTVGIAKSDGAEGDTIFVTRIDQSNDSTNRKRNNRKQSSAEVVAMISQPKVVEINATPISIK